MRTSIIALLLLLFTAPARADVIRLENIPGWSFGLISQDTATSVATFSFEDVFLDTDAGGILGIVRHNAPGGSDYMLLGLLAPSTIQVPGHILFELLALQISGGTSYSGPTLWAGSQTSGCAFDPNLGFSRCAIWGVAHNGFLMDVHAFYERPVAEPSSLALLALGCFMVAHRIRKRHV